MKEYYPRQSADCKNTADLHLQVDASADHTSVYTSVPTLPPTVAWPPDQSRCLVSKYRTISRYRDMKRHDISISLLGYDMNPKRNITCSQMQKFYIL